MHWSPDAPPEAEHDQQRQEHVEAEEDIDHPVQRDPDDGCADGRDEDHHRQGQDEQQHEGAEGDDQDVGRPIGRLVGAVTGTLRQAAYAQNQGRNGEQHHPGRDEKLHQHVPQRIGCRRLALLQGPGCELASGRGAGGPFY